MGGRVVIGGGGRAVAVNKIKTKSSSMEMAFNLWGENQSFLNTLSSCSTLTFILLDTRPLFSTHLLVIHRKKM